MDGAQVNREAQACVIALAPCNELTVAVIKMEIASQLQWRWLVGIASITALLLLGQDLDRHASPFAVLLAQD
jgi:hypothetical protein